MRLPDFSSMQPQPSSLPSQNCPSQLSISPSSILSLPLPSMTPSLHCPRQISCPLISSVPSPCLLPSWKWPLQMMPSWYSQTPRPAFLPSRISPRNLISRMLPWMMSSSTASRGSRPSMEVSSGSDSMMEEKLASLPSMERILDRISFFSNLSFMTTSSSSPIFFSKGAVETPLSSCFSGLAGSVCPDHSAVAGRQDLAFNSSSSSQVRSSSRLIMALDSLFICARCLSSACSAPFSSSLCATCRWQLSTSFLSWVFSSTISWMLLISWRRQFCNLLICVVLTMSSSSMRLSQLFICRSWLTSSCVPSDCRMRDTSLSTGCWANGFIIFIIIVRYNCTMAHLLREFGLANSCLMAAAIEFNLAMFHIFSGPLFANLEGYVFLDLLIWGVSPLLFQICRNPLRMHISLPSDHSGQYASGWLMGCSLTIAVAYLFMNYSESFRWNYFSRIVNLDFGFLLFDLACRCMELVVEVEQEEQHKELTGESSLQPALHRGGYCKYRNMLMMASYFLVFYLSTIYDTEELTSGKEIFRSLSLLSCIFTISIPLLYYLRNRPQEYGQLVNDEELQQIDRVKESQVSAKEQTSSKKIANSYIVFGLVSFSYFVNSSYFSMWVMEGLKNENQKHHQQFNKTLFISSAFFLASSFFQFVASHTYIAFKIKQGLNTSRLPQLIPPFLTLYGILILAMFSLTRQLEWHHMAIAILPFSFHYMLVNYFSQKISSLRQSVPSLPTHHQVFFYCESIAYLAIPALLAIIGQSNAALWIFGYLSGASLILSGLFYYCQ